MAANAERNRSATHSERLVARDSVTEGGQKVWTSAAFRRAAARRNGLTLLGVAILCTIVWAALPLTTGSPQGQQAASEEATTSAEPDVLHADFIAESGKQQAVRQINSQSALPRAQRTIASELQRPISVLPEKHTTGSASSDVVARQNGALLPRGAKDGRRRDEGAVVHSGLSNSNDLRIDTAQLHNGVAIMPRAKDRPHALAVPDRAERPNNPSVINGRKASLQTISIMPRGRDFVDAAAPYMTKPKSRAPAYSHLPEPAQQNHADLSFSQLPSQIASGAAPLNNETNNQRHSILPGEESTRRPTTSSGHSVQTQPFSVLPPSKNDWPVTQANIAAPDLSFSELPNKVSSVEPKQRPAIAGHSFRTTDARNDKFQDVDNRDDALLLPLDEHSTTVAATKPATPTDDAAPVYSVLPNQQVLTEKDSPSTDRKPMTAGHSGLLISNSTPQPALTLPLQTSAISEVPTAVVPVDRSILWWEQKIGQPTLVGRMPLRMSLQQALGLAMSEAPELQVLQSDWFIQQAEVDRQDAAFDWTTFADTVWNRDSNPVGSDLDGAARRLRSRTLAARAGLKKLTRDGSELELAQNFGTNSSNSRFINPNYQGTSRIALQYERPLLQGAGEHYNSSAVRLAEIGKDAAYDRLQAGIQDHLLQVATAYWALVLRRGQYLQSATSLQRARSIADEMASRVEVDVTPAMMDRARSEVAMRSSASIEAEHDIVQAQDALLRLIYGSRFTDFTSQEVLPVTLPMRNCQIVQPESQIEKALHERSEIHEAIREIKAASVRFDVAANEILPVLNMVLTGYVAGLRGNTNIGQAWVDQFQEGEPGVGIGFNFEIPYRNRAAQAKAEQGHIAIRRMQAQLEATIGVVTEDVRNQVIQRNKYGAVLSQQWEALDRARKILKYTETRRAVLADGVAVADLYLENLLQMQSRLEAAEFTYLQSQVRYSLADNALLRAISDLDSIAQP